MIELYGRTIVLLGRPELMARPALVRTLEERGAVLRRGVTRQTDVLVVLRGAVGFVDSGRLEAKLKQADRAGADCLSEGDLLRALGVLPTLPSAPAAVCAQELPAKAGLSPERLRLLTLFDVIACDGSGCNFRDLLVAREAARLLGEGVVLTDILRNADRLRRLGGETAPPAGSRLVRLGTGGIGLRIGTGVASLGGQFLLPLDETSNLAVDVLFEAAEAAEQAQDWAAAERLYRRCLDGDRSDPVIPFNLANVLRETGRQQEAAAYLRRALSRDPDFTEAWYNLALLLEKEGRRSEARRYLEQALQLDAAFADALFNLGRLEFEDGAYLAAAISWEIYAELDPDSDWGRKARQGAALCRRLLRGRENVGGG